MFRCATTVVVILFIILFLIFVYSFFSCSLDGGKVDLFLDEQEFLRVQAPKEERIPFSGQASSTNIIKTPMFQSRIFHPSTQSSMSMTMHVMHAADAWAIRTGPDDTYILFATSDFQAFVMLVTSKTPGSLSASSIFTGIATSRPGGKHEDWKFRCDGPGAKLALLMVATSFGIEDPEVHLDISEMVQHEDVGSDSHTILCFFRHLGDKQQMAYEQNCTILTDYVTPALKSVLAIKTPFLQCNGIFIRDVFGPYPMRRRIMDCICAHDLIRIPASLMYRVQEPLQALSVDLAESMDRQSLACNNLHARFFLYTRQMQDILRRKNEAITEGFSPVARPSTVLEPDDDVPVKVQAAYGGAVRLLELPLLELNGIPLRRGDRVALTQQNRPSENGYYIVLETTPMRAILADKVPLTMDSDVRLLISDDGCHTVAPRHGPYIKALHDLQCRDGDQVYLAQKGWHGTVAGRGQYVQMSCGNQATPIDLNKFHPKALCFENGKISAHWVVQELCEDVRDAMGRAKEPGIWDRPCEIDAECPFFNSNRMYDNKRGGCLASGYCEMPLGMQHTSYRTATGKPMCHGCKQDHDVHCCYRDGKLLHNTVAFTGDGREVLAAAMSAPVPV